MGLGPSFGWPCVNPPDKTRPVLRGPCELLLRHPEGADLSENSKPGPKDPSMVELRRAQLGLMGGWAQRFLFGGGVVFFERGMI